MVEEEISFADGADQEFTDEYKLMMDLMLAEESEGVAKYVSYQSIKDKFLPSDK